MKTQNKTREYILIGVLAVIAIALFLHIQQLKDNFELQDRRRFIEQETSNTEIGLLVAEHLELNDIYVKPFVTFVSPYNSEGRVSVRNNFNENKTFSVKLIPDNSRTPNIAYSDLEVLLSQDRSFVEAGKMYTFGIAISAKTPNFDEPQDGKMPRFVVEVYADDELFETGSFEVIALPQIDLS